MKAVEIKNLSKKFGGIMAIHGASLAIEEGERRVVIGPNGAGKTTLFNLISGFYLPSSGEILLFGRDVTRLPVHRRMNLGLSRTFQVTNLFPNLTLFQNILLGVQAMNRKWLCFYRPIGTFREIISQTETYLKE